MSYKDKRRFIEKYFFYLLAKIIIILQSPRSLYQITLQICTITSLIQLLKDNTLVVPTDQTRGKTEMTKEDLANDIIDQLRGTCDDLMFLVDNLDEDALEVFEDNELFITGQMDDQIFRCEQCCWWCEVSEMSQEIDEVCNNCYEEDD